MQPTVNILKALADEQRCRIVLFLRHGELCVCQVIEMLGLAPSTVSKHLTVLARAGLLESRKQGRWIYYRLAGREAPAAVRRATRWLLESLEGEPQTAQDDKKLQAVRRMSLDDLCCRYKTKG